MKEKNILTNQKNRKNTKEGAQFELESDVPMAENQIFPDTQITRIKSIDSDISYVLAIKEKNHHHVVYLEDDVYEVGRRSNAHIIIKDAAVSRYHATIVKEFNPTESVYCYKIINGGLAGQKNTNGLVINNKYYTSKYLEHEDLIHFSNNVQGKFLVVNKDSLNEDLLVDFDNKDKNDQKLKNQIQKVSSDYTSISKSKLGDLFGDLNNHFRKIINHIGLGDLLIQITINISTPKSNEEPDVTFEYNSNSEDSSSNDDEKIVHTSPSAMNFGTFVKDEQEPIIPQKHLEPSLLPIHGYHVMKSIGKGRFSEVYQAIDHKTQRKVALKILLPEITINQSQSNKLMLEIENTESLKHPNIIELLDCGFSEGFFYCAVEYCERGNLYQLCEQQNSPLTPKQALYLIIPILEGLHYAHNKKISPVKRRDARFATGKGLIHKNLHPNNILLTEKDGKIIPKIADLGIAKAFNNIALNGLSPSEQNLEGAFQFMPKEQLINFKYPKPAIDVWAVAACLYYLLTLRYPRDFEHGDKHPLLTVIQTKPIPIKQRNPSIPDNLAEIIDLALADSGKLYFQNAMQFKQALYEILSQNI